MSIVRTQLELPENPHFPLRWRLWAQWADYAYHWLPLFFADFSETIHEPLSALPCPLAVNVNRSEALKTSTEPTFKFFVTCVGPVCRLGIPVASPIFANFWDRSRPSQCNTLPSSANWNSWDTLGASREHTFPLNVNRYAVLKTSTEPTFPVFATCVGPVGILDIPLP